MPVPPPASSPSPSSASPGSWWYEGETRSHLVLNPGFPHLPSALLLTLPELRWGSARKCVCSARIPPSAGSRGVGVSLWHVVKSCITLSLFRYYGHGRESLSFGFCSYCFMGEFLENTGWKSICFIIWKVGVLGLKSWPS